MHYFRKNQILIF